MRAVGRNRIRRIPKSRRRDVTRGEFNGLVDRLNERAMVIDNIHDEMSTAQAEIHKALEIQFKRIAQMQLELDALTAARAKTTQRRRQKRA